MIEINADPIETIHVKLVGVEYDLMPPKVDFTLDLATEAGSLMGKGDDLSGVPALRELLNEWMQQAFQEQYPALKARLKNAKDPIDFPHIVQLMRALIEAKSGNPTS